MAKARGKDGMPVEVPSRPGGVAKAAGQPEQVPPMEAAAGHPFRLDPYLGEAPTRPPRMRGAESEEAEGQPGHGGHGEAPTEPSRLRAMRRGPGSSERRKGSEDAATVFPPTEKGHPRGRSTELTTGWLVVVDGPGKGASFPLGFGPHRIGRDRGMRVALDFGDKGISRDSHAVVSYDPRGNRFFVQPVNNLVYQDIDGELEPVLTPKQIATPDELVLGRTRLRFVSLCDDSFVWE